MKTLLLMMAMLSAVMLWLPITVLLLGGKSDLEHFYSQCHAVNCTIMLAVAGVLYLWTLFKYLSK